MYGANFSFVKSHSHIEPVTKGSQKTEDYICGQRDVILHGTHGDKKWTTFRLVPSTRTQNDENIGGAIPSFVKIGMDLAAKEAWRTEQKTSETLDIDTRACGSPESGIDCDEVSASDDCSGCPGATMPPQDSDSASIGTLQDKISAGAKSLVDFKCPENHATLSSAADMNNAEVQEPCLQIISIHSLAPVSDNNMIRVDTEPVQKPFANEPLPKCSRLFVRKIRGLNRLMKNVLMVEADYGRAATLPPLPKRETAHKRHADPAKTLPGFKIPRQNSLICNHKKIITKNDVKHPSVNMGRQRISGKRNVGKRLGVRARDSRCQDAEGQCAERDETGTESNILGDGWMDCVTTGASESNKRLVSHAPSSSKDRMSKTKYMSPVLPRVPDRISQLREKLKQKEADLDEIRRNMSIIDNLAVV